MAGLFQTNNDKVLIRLGRFTCCTLLAVRWVRVGLSDWWFLLIKDFQR